jgi:hypothetical protein
MSEAEASAIGQAIVEGRLDEAIARVEGLADQGVVGAGLAFDRGLAYALRARSGTGLPGDLGRAAHAFEEALRRDPHDDAARKALEEVRREVARRDARARGRAEELEATPIVRTIAVSLPGDGWAAIAIASSASLAVAIALRPRLRRGARLAASTIAIVAALLAIAASTLGLGARWVRSRIREAVVVAPRVVATADDGASIDLAEGDRVDVVEERATKTLVHTAHGDGWAPRDALRRLPPYRP